MNFCKFEVKHLKQHWRSNSFFINFVRHIRQLLWAPSLLHCFVLCLVGDCGKIVIFTIFAKFAAFANFDGAPSLLCVFLVGDCGKIVIFAIFAKFANIFSFLPFLLLCAFLDISQPKRGNKCHLLVKGTYFSIFGLFGSTITYFKGKNYVNVILLN